MSLQGVGSTLGSRLVGRNSVKRELDGAEGSRPPGGSVSGASAHLGSGLAPTLPTWDKVTAQTAHVLGQNSLPKKGASANLREKVGN